MFQIGDNVFAEVVVTAWNKATVTITGSGDMYEDVKYFVNLDSTSKWSDVQQRCSGVLNIPDGVTSIASNFMNARDFIGTLTTVNIGKDVTRIGNYAFGSIQLQDLTVINISPEANITRLGNGCFYGLRNLQVLDFHGTVIQVGEKCFYDCQNIDNINLSKKVEKFYNGTFYNCKKLKSFNYKNCINDLSVDAFSSGCFTNCNSLTEVTFKYGVAFPVSGGNNFMKVDDFAGIDCDAEGNLKTLIWTNNPQVSERDWLGLDNRNVTIKRIPSTLAIKHQSKIYDLHYFDQV